MKKATGTLRAVGYCRTSGEGQRDNTSIPIQRDGILAACKRNEWKFLRHYVDECKSGATEEGRDAFQQMMRDAASGHFDVIVPFDVKRFSRDGVDILGNAKALRKLYGIFVVDSKGQFDNRTTRNTLLNFVHAGSAEDERLTIMERTIGGRIKRAEEGKPWSGKQPFGRTFDRATGEWFVNERGKRMAQLLKRYVAGEGLAELVRTEFKEFSSSQLVLNFVRVAQLSGVYVKTFNIPEIGIKELAVPVPAIPEIITPALMKKVKARSAHLRTWNQEHRRKYLLTGFLRCGQCGTAMTGNCTGGRIYYRHCTPKRSKEFGCLFHSIREDEFLGPALDYLYSFVTDEPTFNAAVSKALPTKDERTAVAQDYETTKQQLAKVEKEILRLTNAVAEGADASLIIQGQSERKAQKERCTERLAAVKAKLDEMPSHEQFAHRAMAVRLELLKQVQKRNWRKLSFDEIRQFLVFLFGENTRQNGNGIRLTRYKGRWRIAFQGRVFFDHDVIGGRPTFRPMLEFAEQHNKDVEQHSNGEFVALKRQT